MEKPLLLVDPFSLSLLGLTFLSHRLLNRRTYLTSPCPIRQPQPFCIKHHLSPSLPESIPHLYHSYQRTEFEEEVPEFTMNDLFSGSFSRFRNEDYHSPGNIPMSNTNVGGGGVNLDKFFEDVESIKDDLGELEKIYSSLQSANEQSKTLHNAKSVKDLRSRMDRDVSSALKKAKVIKVRLEALDRANAANRSLPGCGPGSSSDRTRTSVVNGLRKKLQDSMESFNGLRQQIAGEYKDTVKRRYFTVTGENADESTIDNLIASGESENFLQKAIQEQGRGKVMDTIMEIQERHEGVKEIERNLAELHQVFLDMAVLVETQGQQIDDIESQVNRASSFVRGGTEQLTVARKHQRNTRKWTCYGIILLLIVILIVVLALKPWDTNKSSPSPGPNLPAPSPPNPPSPPSPTQP